MKKLSIYVFLICALCLITLLLLFTDNNEKTNVNIPKIINFVWLGSKELPDEVKDVIATWEKHNPDFKIVRWDETNCDINANEFVRIAYKEKKYNFASDWCRVLALENGGIYFDTDMILKQSITPLLDASAVFVLQRKNDLSASFIAVEPNHPFILALKQNYENFHYENLEYEKYEDVTPYAPTMWNKTFQNFFHKKNIKPKKFQKKYHIYAPNILMYNFNGGENVAEHIFANGNSNLEKSDWYNKFRMNFLTFFAYYLTDKKFYMIKKDASSAYFIDNKSQKIKDVFYKYFLGFLYILDDERKIYFCRKNICHPILNLAKN